MFKNTIIVILFIMLMLTIGSHDAKGESIGSILYKMSVSLDNIERGLTRIERVIVNRGQWARGL